MISRHVPQPHPARLTPFVGHPAVVGISPGQQDLVPLAALAWSQAGNRKLFFAYADPSRYVIEEYSDGSVRHGEIDPDIVDDQWRQRQQQLERYLHQVVGDQADWEFRYLAGRPDRALTHLARAVDAAVIIVGTRAPSARGFRAFIEGSLGVQLAHHQHRPVLMVPLTVVSWETQVS